MNDNIETKYTPGPWTLKSDLGIPLQIMGAPTSRNPRYNPVTRCGTTFIAPMSEEAMANARLIAAAPELLEAPQIAHECGRPSRISLYDEDGVEGWEWSHPDGRIWTVTGDWSEEPMHPLVVAAIAKATGKP